MSAKKHDGSKITWLSFDQDEISEVLSKLKDLEMDATVDVLGLGPVADRLSDIFFPGTSTLHTRLRYTVFIPSIVLAMMEHGKVGNPRDLLTKLQKDLQKSLELGKETLGVIGRRTQSRGPVYSPAGTYWTFIRRLRMFGAKLGDEIDRATLLDYSAAVRDADDSEQESAEIILDNIDPKFRKIANGIIDPETLKVNAPLNFRLTPAEREYITSKLQEFYPRSVATYLLSMPRGAIEDLSSVFNVAGLVPEIQNVLENAEKFSRLAMGATYAYRWALCDHLLSYYRDDDKEAHRWKTGRERNAEHFKIWLKSAVDLRKWSVRELRIALGHLAKFEEFSKKRHADWIDVKTFPEIEKFCDDVSREIFSNSGTKTKLEALAPILMAREAVTKPGRSHFDSPEIGIPDVTLSVTEETELHLYGFRFKQGRANALDLSGLRRVK